MTDQLPAEAFGTVLPAYGEGSLADLMPSVSALLGVPGTTDVLGLGAQLEGVDRIAVLLVDGLGSYQIPVAAAYAPILQELPGRELTAGFPSTTPVSLVTLGTGALPGAHGVLGFTLRKPDGGILNHIKWGSDPDPAQWQPVPTRFEQAMAAGVHVTQVTRPEFEGTGLTVAANRGATFAGGADPQALSAGMLAALSRPGLVYGYHPDLDHHGHASGVDSEPWRAAAAEVGELVSRLVDGLPPNAALLVTADHGQLNVPLEGRIDLSADPRLAAGLTAVAGEPRVRYLYVEDGALDDVVAAWREVLGDAAWVLTREEAIASGLYGPVPPAHLSRLGDVVVICQGRTVVLAGGWEPPAVGQLIAYHGSVTAAEMTIPLLVAR
ncbi:alkaline phosphatase family protein [Actinoplanes friuliensis]|uniref:Putative phosphodiesterase/nucleotide pyrophosphatase n=1 Tax=Actinoplanes friuliensis DSM 7358 TaxID=1246995 RepID=U5VX23_9ACTN|nr:nucleotide pyrophosphatase/phosphodiesterase family protein [Actinoplanes friuliensis]AGZ40270.1 putative phosphodiesterase/nucleotide pyrophosphatase [Actinoplanes friuliensis DSM 7358]